MPGLKRYFNEQIVPLKDNMKTRSIKLNGIEKLKVREIKGLITTKILQAQEKKIPISIEVPDEIDKIDMNTIELSRITGILLIMPLRHQRHLKIHLFELPLLITKNLLHSL